jgi:UDP:flavonoid glycosyltransferase YjiC (YdhE family)
MFEGSYSPSLVLGMFSELLGPRQPDWPAQAVATGFPFYDRDGEDGLPPEVERFLDAGEPPLVFTLGTSAVLTPGRFYQESANAARILGRRAILLTGRDPENQPERLPEGILCVSYAPYSAIFPRAAAIVHQGGVGTTGQAMRAGKPMLVVPWAVDQPDNAERVRRLGIARVLSRSAYTAKRAAREIDALLNGHGYRERARQIEVKVSAEDGAAVACDRLEALL